jgi:transposase-like protein
MGIEESVGKPTTRRYTPEDKARAVRLVRQLRKELGTPHGTIQLGVKSRTQLALRMLETGNVSRNR